MCLPGNTHTSKLTGKEDLGTPWQPVALQETCGPGTSGLYERNYCLQEEVWVYVESVHEDFDIIFGRLCTPCHILGFHKDSRQVIV